MQNSAARAQVDGSMTPLEAHSDEGLMQLLQEGQTEALSVLVKRYQNDLFYFCLHYMRNVERAKEATQDTYLRIFRARERFDTSKNYKTWMLCIARNVCLTALTRKKVTAQVDSLEDMIAAHDNGNENFHAVSEGPADAMMTSERYEALMEALDELPTEAREIVILRYFERMSAREIAEIVDSTEGAIRTRIHRILKQLRVKCMPFRENV